MQEEDVGVHRCTRRRNSLLHVFLEVHVILCGKHLCCMQVLVNTESRFTLIKLWKLRGCDNPLP
eukprot:1539773-Prorocentrum_lima.AAC.1